VAIAGAATAVATATAVAAHKLAGLRGRTSPVAASLAEPSSAEGQPLKASKRS